MKNLRILFALTALGFPGVAHAGALQEALGNPGGLTLEGTFRTRYEALDGQFRRGLDSSDDIVALRTTLFAEYDTGPIRFGAELTDARAYDTDPGSSVGTGDVNALELTQAYIGADFGDIASSGSDTSLDIGRFTMDFGSRRFIGRNNFRNSINAFTGGRLAIESESIDIRLFYTLPHQRLPSDKPAILDNDIEWDRESFDLVFWGGTVTPRDIWQGSAIDGYFLALDEDDSPARATRDRHLFTSGLRLYRDPEPGRTDFEFEGAYQFGEISASSDAGSASLDVSAWFVHAEIGHQFDAPWQPRVALEYDLASGDGPGRSYGRLDTLFGVRRPDYGPTGI